MLHLPRIMIAAPSSGSGKTMITCGILNLLKRRGMNPCSFKCGPDYIDPMFHAKVIGTPSKNLDVFFTTPDTTRYLFCRSAREAGISVMEGVMGLYDGLGGTTMEASSYDLACTTQTPVILVINAKGMSLSMIPFLRGFVDYQKSQGNVIRGVLLNHATHMTTVLLKQKIETETGLCLLGYIPELEACRIESRHLGLILPDEITDLQSRLDRLSDELEKTIDVERLIQLSESAADYPEEALTIPCLEDIAGQSKKPRVRIAVAWDEAFCFYYQDNLELLHSCGADLVYFSPIRDRRLPEKISGFLLGGGYPELYTEQLSSNHSMLESIRHAVNDQMPYLAECGGFMYLHEQFAKLDGTNCPMTGIIKADTWRTPKLGRFGYITLSAGEHQLLPAGEVIRGHEFHYYESSDPGEDYHAVKPVTGRSWDCMHGTNRSACGYPHLYYWSNPGFVMNFLDQARAFDKGIR